MVDELLKQADPNKRERLVASKKAWNKTVKLLIAKLIAFKRGINGEGDEDAMLPEVDLKDRYPTEYQTYLASIVDDYTKVIEGANFVMDLQDDFSITRRKSQKEMRTESDFKDFELVSEASWWGSRAWAWFQFKTKLGKDASKERWKMLSFTHKSISALKSIEYKFLNTSMGSDLQGILALSRFINLFVGGLLPRLERLKKLEAEHDAGKGEDVIKGLPKQEPVNESVEQPTESIPSEVIGGPPPSGPSIDEMRAAPWAELRARLVGVLNNSGIDSNIRSNIENLYVELKRQSPPGKSSDSDYEHLYKSFVKELETAEKAIGVDLSSQSSAEDEYRKIAQNVLQRWWARKKLDWGANKSDNVRLLVADEVKDTTSKMKELLEWLENPEVPTSGLEEKIDEIKETLKSAGEQTLILADNYRFEWEIEEDRKKRPPRLNESVTSKLKGLLKRL